MAYLAAKEAIKDAGIDFNNTNKTVGLAVGTVLGDIEAGQKYWRNKNFSGCRKLPKNYPLGAIEFFLSQKLKIYGPAFTLSNSCASGADSIGLAYRLLQSEDADIFIAGGVDSLSEFAFSGFSSLRALTKDKVRPFDARRNGLALGEGAGFLVLEKLDRALSRKAKIYGEILGYGAFNEAYHLSRPHPQAKGLAQSISSAMKEAGIPASQIGYINAHGTGTRYNDKIETEAIKKALGQYAYRVPVSSTKSMLGHSLGASAAQEAIICLLAINTGIIPPTINYSYKDRACDLDYVANKARSKKINIALSLSAGFGGQNSAIILGKFKAGR